MKRRGVLEEEAVAMVGQEGGELKLVAEAKEMEEGLPPEGKLKRLAATHPRCCCCLKGLAVTWAFATVLLLIASHDPFGEGEGWKCDDVWTKVGVRDEEFPQKLAYYPSQFVDKEEDGEYVSAISPKITKANQFLGKTQYVGDKLDARAALEAYTTMRDSKCGVPGADGSSWETAKNAGESPHVKDFCIKQRNGPDAVTDLPYAWCNDTAPYELHFCRVPDSETEDDPQQTRTTNAWTIMRVGPLKTTGGYDWNSVEWKGQLADVAELMLEHGHDALYIDASFASTMKPSGEYWGFPPLHAHHFHLTPNDDLVGPVDFAAQLQTTPLPRFYNGWGLIHELHGDTSCTEESGGVACNYEGFSPGTAIKVPISEYAKGDSGSKGLFEINCEFNDVRAKGSDEIEWYLEVAVHHFVAQGSDETPKMVVSRDTVAPTFLPFPIPYFTPSVTWNSHIFDYVHPDNELQTVYVHTHHTILDSQWLFQATQEDLGLTPDNFYTLTTHVWWKDYVPATKGKTISDVKRHVLDSLAKSQAAWDAEHPELADEEEGVKAKNGYPRALCKTTATTVEFIDNPTTAASVQGRMYDKQIPVQCASDFTKIDVGMYVTAVNFNRASAINRVSGILRRLLGMRKYGYYSGGMQHNFWRFVYAEPNSADAASHINFYVVARPEDGVDTPSANTKVLHSPRGFAPPTFLEVLPTLLDVGHLHFLDWFEK